MSRLVVFCPAVPRGATAACRAALVALLAIAVMVGTLSTPGTALATSSGAQTTVSGSVGKHQTRSTYVNLAKPETITVTLQWASASAELDLSLRGQGGAVEAHGTRSGRSETLTYRVSESQRFRIYFTAKQATAYTLSYRVGAGTPSTAPAPSPIAKPAPTTFPSAATTGVPAGTTLRPSKSLTITEDGQVVDAVHVTGTIRVKADNVVIRRSKVSNTGQYPIRIYPGYTRLLVEDTEIDGRGTGGVAVGFANYTLRRVNIHHVTEGPRLSSNTAVVDSWIHHLVRCKGCHVDALQSTGGTNILIRGNRLEAYNTQTGDPMNAAFQFGEETNKVRNCLVERNWMSGGNMTVNGGGGGTTGAACTFRQNVLEQSARYGPRGGLGLNSRWESSNVWHHNGKVIS